MRGLLRAGYLAAALACAGCSEKPSTVDRPDIAATAIQSDTKTAVANSINNLHLREETEKHFSLINGNAQPEDAEIIFIGENHGFTDNAAMCALIDSVGKKGDILFLEGGETVAKPDDLDETRGLKTDVVVQGWEYRRIYDEHRKVIVQFWDTYKQMKIEQDPQKKKLLEAQWRSLRLRMKSLTPMRNERLRQMLTLDTDNQRRKFIWAGTLHYSDDEALQALLAKRKFIVLELKMPTASLNEQLKRAGEHIEELRKKTEKEAPSLP